MVQVQHSSNLVEKRMLDVVIKVHDVAIPVSQPNSVLSFKWSRNGKSVPSKEFQIDASAKVQKVDEHFTGRPNFKFDQVKRAWLPDLNEIAVYCNDEKVGSVNFDLASFID